MRFPWVGRELYEVAKRDRDARIAQLEEREKLLLNTLAELGWGMPLFPEIKSFSAVSAESAETAPAGEGAEDETPNQEIPDSLLELAMRETGSRNPRVLCRHIDRMLGRGQGVPDRALEKIQKAESEGVSQGLARAAAQAQEA